MQYPRRGASGRLLEVAFILGAFALGTSENVVAGMLPQLGRAFHSPIGQTSLLITAYAGTAVVAGPLLAILTSAARPFRLVVAATALYGVGSLLAAFAPTFAVLFLARVLTGATHTTILVMFMLAALKTAAPDRKAQAVGRITLGLGVATVIGVPIGTALAQSLGWRASFGAISIFMVVTLALVLLAYPQLDRSKLLGLGALRVISRPAVGSGIAMSALTALGALTLLAFIVPVLRHAGVAAGSLTLALFVYGIACLAGNQLGAMLADRSLLRALSTSLALTCTVLFAATFSSHTGWLAVLALSGVGLAYFSTFPPLNTWVATASSDLAPALALALNSSAFNLGIAAASLLGGGALQAGLPVSRLPLVGLPAVFAALLIALQLQRHTEKADVELTGSAS